MYKHKNEHAIEKYSNKKLALSFTLKEAIIKYEMPIGTKKQAKYLNMLFFSFLNIMINVIPITNTTIDEKEMLIISNAVANPKITKINPTR